MYDVMSVGDTTLDCFLTLSPDEADLHCELKKHTTEICFNYAGKIPVEGLDFSLGGNAPNVAVGLKRLGFEPGLYTIHGQDEAGRMVDEELASEGLSKEFVQSEKGKTSYSTVINYGGERTILEKKEHRTYKLPANFPATKFLYVSSLGPDYQSFFEEISKFVKENGIKLGFNPAQPQLRSDFKTYESIVKASHFIFMNKEELRQMLGDLGNLGTIKKAMEKVAGFGPKYVVITDGREGAYCFDGEKYYFCPIFPTEAVEATGAGDAFASGFMGAIMHGRDASMAMKWGMVNSASVVSQVGAVAGLLSKEEIEKKIKKNPSFGPVEI